MGYIEFVKALRVHSGIGLRDAKFVTDGVFQSYRTVLNVGIDEADIFKMKLAYYGKIEAHKDFPRLGTIRFLIAEFDGEIFEVSFPGWVDNKPIPTDPTCAVLFDASIFKRLNV